MNKMDGYLSYYENLEFYYKTYKSSHLGKEYEQLQKQEAELIKSITEEKNLVLLQALYHYLVWNGFFSAGGSFLGASEDIIELRTEKAIAIACGSGCCRNFACHFKNLANRIGNNSLRVVGTKYKEKRDTGSGIEGLQEKINKESFHHPKNIFSLFFPNHTEVLDLTHISQPRLLDPFNFGVHTVLNERTLLKKKQMIDFGMGMVIDYNMDSEVRNQIIKNGESLEKEFSKRKLEPLPIKERKVIYQQAIDLCNEKRDLLEEYKRQMNPVYQNIKEEAKVYQKMGY